MQQSVDITPEDTPETLEAKIHPVEYSLYPRAIVAALGRMEGRASGSPAEPPVATPPETPRSVDSAWADALHLKYDEKEAAERKAGRRNVPPRARSRRFRAAAPRAAVPSAGPGGALSPDVPKSHMTAAILTTILCCTIPGVVAIVYAASVNSRLAAGDRGGRAPRLVKAEGWAIASFVLGLLSATLWLPVSIISAMF